MTAGFTYNSLTRQHDPMQDLRLKRKRRTLSEN